jgi:hypothetical protein
VLVTQGVLRRLERPEIAKEGASNRGHLTHETLARFEAPPSWGQCIIDRSCSLECHDRDWQLRRTRCGHGFLDGLQPTPTA